MNGKSNTWWLWLDDERSPRRTEPWVIARNSDEAKFLITQMGCPCVMSLDHDLGLVKTDDGTGWGAYDYLADTGFDFVKWLVAKDLDEHGTFLYPWPHIRVHSANLVGRENMVKYLEGYYKVKERQGRA